MTHDEAIHILTEHNMWRRGEGVYGGVGVAMPLSPEELGRAIQYAIDQLKATQWQPIESAPKDGTYVLVYPHKVTKWFDDDGFTLWDYNNLDEFGNPKIVEPKHFMPLPQPPQGETE